MKNANLKNKLSPAIAKFGKKMSVCAAIIAFFALLLYFIPQNVTYEYNNAASTNQKVKSAQPSTQELRTLRLSNGKIGVFKSDGTLLRSVELNTELLTNYDISLLQSGITATEKEISELLASLES